ncbi:MAG: AAA family ATPase [Desulfitobacteriia bacterium]|jgi:stage V sporulation protein K
MSVTIIFRNNLPPLIHRTQPKKNDQSRGNLDFPLPANPQERDIHNREQEKEERIENILSELDEMIGLKKVKKLIYELQAFVEIQRKREKENLATEPLVLHMIFKGNPGSGKTTIARLIGKLFKELGVLKIGQVIECERADLVGEYVGHTAQKTRTVVKKALGGVLFIDEAYSLSRGGERDFGKEAIEVLIKAMEDHKDDFILILAGYEREMDCFIKSNPGLRSRFPIQITFPDYTLEELLAIGELMLSKRDYRFSPQAKLIFRETLEKMLINHQYSGNARLVRNIIEKTIRKQAVRLYRQAELSREELIWITEQDLI